MSTRRAVFLLIAVLGALVSAAPIAVAAGPPTAATAPASAVGRTDATLGGTVGPNALATTWHVEYGTTTAYGLRTAEGDAGAGDAPVPVGVPVAGLTPDTVYHFRVVATNAAGVTPSADRAFRTAAVPGAPGVTIGATQVGADSATVTGRVDPNSVETTYTWEYGTTAAYGASTPPQTLPAGPASRAVRASITGLSPATTYHVRLVATNAEGVTPSIDRTFRTLSRPTAISVAVDPAAAQWSSTAAVTGRVSGQGVGRVTVALERQDFPFVQGFRQETTTRTATDGSFRLVTAPLWSAARLRVVTRTTLVATSPVVAVANRLLVGLRTARSAAGTVVSGSISPAVPRGRASLQRRTSTGRWVPLRRAALQPLGGNRSRYRFTLRAAQRASVFRVVVVPNDAGAHARGISRERNVRARGQLG